MTKVAKYNLCKGVSAGLTFGTPLVTLLCMGETFLSEPSRTVSASAVFSMIIAAFFLKDKLAEKFKAPGAFVLALAAFGFCAVVENIIQPIKVIALATMIASGVDELTFKRLYKGVELLLPKEAEAMKKLGFYTVRQKTVDTLAEVKGGQD